METTIYMVRHAESQFVFGEERSRGLSEEGLVDAQRVAELLYDVDVDYVASSAYARAIQTVQYYVTAKLKSTVSAK
jgi:2,3-bisphosphoglycerate-dependent phosphoglycerate mutase